MKLNEIREAQSPEAQPSLNDLFYMLRGEAEDLAFTPQELLSLLGAHFQGGSPSALFLTEPRTAVASDHGRMFAIADDSVHIEIDEGVPAGWLVWLANPEGGSGSLTYPANSTGPEELEVGVFILVRGPDDLSEPETPIRQFALLPIWTPPAKAAHVADADATSLETLAGSINAIRNALVSSGLMFQVL